MALGFPDLIRNLTRLEVVTVILNTASFCVIPHAILHIWHHPALQSKRLGPV